MTGSISALSGAPSTKTTCRRRRPKLANTCGGYGRENPLDDFEPTQGLIVEKGKLAANGEYNLSGERYRDRTVATSNFPIVPLSELAKVKNGFAFKSKEYVSEGLRVLRIKNVQEGEVIDDDPKFIALARRKEFTDFALKSGDILMSLTGNVGRVGRLKPEHEPAVLNQRVAHICPYEDAHCLPEFLFPLLNTDKFKSDAVAASSGIAQANLSSKWVGEYQIPLPPLEVQKEIVAEIEGYQKVINGARAVVDNYRPQITIDPDWPMVAIGDVCVVNPNTVNPQDLYPNSYFNYIDISCVENGTGLFLGANRIASTEAPSRARRAVERDDVLVSTVRPNLRAFAILTEIPHRAIASTGFAIIRPKDDNLVSQFLILMMRNEMSVGQMVRMMGKGSYPSINQVDVESIQIPLPPLEVQKEIVAEVESEQALVTANRELIARVWGGAEPDTAEA